MNLMIKGMDMPSSCDDCTLRSFTFNGMACPLIDENVINQEFAYKRHSNCPLSEIPAPHGDLIDRDGLMKVIEANDYTLQSYYNTTDRGMFTIGIKQAIDETPTIIEAEE